MELDEILRKLYSRNKIEILSVINTAYHISIENYGRLVNKVIPYKPLKTLSE